MIKKVILSFLLAAAATNIEVDAQGQAGTIIGNALNPNAAKNCNQVACWIGTTSSNCVRDMAEKIQATVMKGNDGYMIESIGSSGGWVRYWRVPNSNTNMGRGKIAQGTCAGGAKYVVENCQVAGAVRCVK
ncbi:hypothetical protein FI667_g14068, partial [Globisporangium splendens]